MEPYIERKMQKNKTFFNETFLKYIQVNAISKTNTFYETSNVK